MRQSDLDSLSRLSLLVFRAQQALSAEGDRLTARWGLTSAKWKVLGALALSGEELSVAAIGRAMGLSRQAAIKQIHPLLKQGMLKQRPDPRDARAPLHSLTPKGRAVYEAIFAAWQQRTRTLASGLRKPDFDAACTVIETLLERLERTPSAKESRR